MSAHHTEGGPGGLFVRLPIGRAELVPALVTLSSTLVGLTLLAVAGWVTNSVFYIVGTRVRRCGGAHSFGRFLVELTLDATHFLIPVCLGLALLLVVSGLAALFRLRREAALVLPRLARTQLSVSLLAFTLVATYLGTLAAFGPSPFLETHGYEGRSLWEDGRARLFMASAAAGLIPLLARAPLLSSLARTAALVSLLVFGTLWHALYLGDLMPMCIVEPGRHAHVWSYLSIPGFLLPTLVWWFFEREALAASRARAS